MLELVEFRNLCNKKDVLYIRQSKGPLSSKGLGSQISLLSIIPHLLSSAAI